MPEPVINHQKPTVEELEAQIKATEELIDKQIAEDVTPPVPSTPAPAPSIETPPEPPTPPVDDDTEDDEDVTPPVPSTPAPDDEKEVDYKKKFAESQREALVLHAKTKKYEQLSAIPEPTEAELQIEYPEWQEMSATEKKLAKDVVWNNRRFTVIDNVNSESKNVEEWNTKVDAFIVDPKVLIAHPELEGKQEDFKIFATKPTRRAVDMEDLVLAFNGEQALNKPAPKKGQMFEQGSAGLNTPVKPKDDKLSVEEAAKLMETDYKKYKEYLIAGKIKSE